MLFQILTNIINRQFTSVCFLRETLTVHVGNKRVAETKKKQEVAENAESANADSIPAADAKKKGGLVGVVLTPLILAAVSFGTVFLLPTAETSAPSSAHGAEASESTDLHDFMPTNLEIVEMDEFVVSIRDDKNILRMSLALEVPKQFYQEVNPNELRLRDAFMGYLRAVEIAELQDPAFLPQLRAQLLRRSRLVLGQEKVAGVLITDFLIR